MGSLGTDTKSQYLSREPIAIVGSSCRFPGGATSPSRLWDLLENPRDVLQEIPPSRFNTKAFHNSDSQHHGSANVKHAYLLDEDPRAFDRDFFSINPKEAEAMDPQQRMLLETVYEGVESTGYSMQQLRGSSTAVFVGCMSFDYQFTAIRGIESLPQYHGTGTAASILANRVSYFYDWRGPSIAIDTACSSSLVALHQAVSALRNGEAEMAVAAGSNLIIGPEPFVSESKLNMLSPNGRSFMWDASADGYTRGEGFSAIFLKTLSRAIADGDHIESIVRETGVNSDGKTPGITMPSSESQARLIRDTYARCGLNLALESDRPQYFEAHGTGTQAGDPIEARAIRDVFFPDGKDGELLVGSIKTVIGHTEGTAGVAGVLKASLAVQHGIVPANLHFKKLNPKIIPFYDNLRIPTETLPWPRVAQGAPRRVSVNSFGFGGTNAHAIIESWDGPDAGPLLTNGHATNGHAINGTNGHTINSQPARWGGPFVLSANSATALSANAAALAEYLRSHPNTDLIELAHTLFRKTEFPFRTAVSATSAEQLADKLEAGKDALKSITRSVVIPEILPLRILGVFTGQGAQWATMGKELYTASQLFRNTVDQMQDSLDSLPEKDRPTWTLVDQLDAPAAISRVGEATVSQPLCTALQVALVNVLRATGIEFSAVVGHSSGEIGAAYAAGYLSAKDAIRVAYYRGVHSHLAQGPDGKRGKMMAVGMSMAQATTFCHEYGSTLAVAASNSQTSCTLAGDSEAIDAAFAQLQENGTFARVLQVDTAYHSHHMKPCGSPYLESMKACGVKVQKGRKECTWYSSVWGSEGRIRSFDQETDGLLLEGQYWVDNMTQAVLFSQALSRALNEDQYLDLALEIGPHPALKGPSSETIKSLTGLSMPYSGVLKRGQNAVESFADALGLLWKTFPSSRPVVTFDGLRQAFPSGKHHSVNIIKGLPTYSWDHPNLIWKESRTSRNYRTQPQTRHELLGHSITHGDKDKKEMHWKQLLRLNELPWLAGHKIQGEVLFPASGYLSMAFEAAIRLVDEKQSLRLVELHDIDIVRAMRLEQDSSGLEVVFTIRVTSHSDEYITAEVACYSGAVDSVQPLDAPQAGLAAHFTGGVKLWLGEADEDALPQRTEPLLPMDSLDMDNLYNSLSKEGFNYTDRFQAKAMLRRLNYAVVTVASPPEPCLIRHSMHPSPVDTAFQGLLAAFSFPEDGRISSIYLPTRVDCVRVNMMPSSSKNVVLTADASITSVANTTMTGNVDIFDASNEHTEVQIRGVHMTAVGQRKDPWLYATTAWARDAEYGIEPGQAARLSAKEWQLYEHLSRTAYFYLRNLSKKILKAELILMGKYRKHMMVWVLEHLLPQIEAGKHPYLRAEWKNDTAEMIEQWRTQHDPDDIDMNIVHAMGKNLVNIVRGTTPPLKVLTQDGMLDRLYVEGIGAKDGNVDITALMKQLSHQYPRMKIVEIGAGTGGTTRAVFNGLGNQFGSYTYTDISTGFFENARNIFGQFGNKLIFKTLNIENDPVEQGFINNSYDLVVSSNCLHATRSLDETLRHCRQLLRPGGRLVLLEITTDFLPTQLVMSTLPGWFLGVEDGRVWAPTVSVERWDELLRANGFAGVNIASTPSFCSVISAQAVDETVQFLREPLANHPITLPSLSEDIIIVSGGVTSAKIAAETEVILKKSVPNKTISIIAQLEAIQVPKGATVLSLGDVDVPAFRNMTAEKFRGLQDLMENAEAVLWVTVGAKSGDAPEANVIPGLSSTLRAERMDLRLQFLDIEEASALDASMLAKMLLRLCFLDPARQEEMLWTQEPEVALKDGALYIPRVVSLDTTNRRSAARIRQVNQPINPNSNTAVIVATQRRGKFELQNLLLGNVGEGQTQIQVAASSAVAIASDTQQPVYASIGKNLATGENVLSISSSNASQIVVSQDQILSCLADDPNSSPAAALKQLAHFLTRAVAHNLLSSLKGTTWIHGASKDLSRAIAEVAAQKKLNVLQTTSERNPAGNVIFIHQFASERQVQDLFPKDLENFINLATAQNGTIYPLVQAVLPTSAISNLNTAKLSIELDIQQLRNLAEKYVRVDFQGLDSSVNFVSIDKLETFNHKDIGPATIIDWNTNDLITTLVRPLDHKGLFSADKTYLLCGMTGDLGISVCLWMVEHGACYVVLTSRNPKVSPTVLDYLARKGAVVRPMAVDIANMDSLRTAYAEIKATMPPVGGVMNAAMVLQDRLFHHLPWEDFSAVLAPKMVGSKHLDQLFGDEPLEFFICFSSTTSIVGSIGQSAYAAANHYMASLVQQRVRRGLAGSVLHIAILTGFGYIFRRDSDHAETIYKAILPRFDRQSETDLHNMLAEAVISGRPGAEQTPELITGIRPVFQGEWRDDPRLSCYTGQQQIQDDSSNEQSAASASVEVQLAAAEDPVECLSILEACFAQALGHLLELDPETLDSKQPVASLGIDSLVAIRIREWFLREMGVDVPVLKVMSDSYSMSRMCDDVLVDWRKQNKS